MAQASLALEMARGLLNDVLTIKWTDIDLMPRLKMAHRELQTKLRLNQVPVTKKVPVILTVPANSTSLTSTSTGSNIQPTDLIEPISMYERDVGSDMDDFDEMQQVSYIPPMDMDTTLIYWAWISESIQLVGATQVREVLLRYTGGIMVPERVTDPIGIMNGELYLGPRIAYLATGNKAFATEAERSLDMIVRSSVLANQGTPRRRIPYRYRGRGGSQGSIS